MKYENLQKAENLCKAIDSMQSDLNMINCNGILVRLETDRTTALRIGTDSPFREQALNFIQVISDAMKAKIAEMKAELDTL